MRRCAAQTGRGGEAQERAIWRMPAQADERGEDFGKSPVPVGPESWRRQRKENLTPAGKAAEALERRWGGSCGSRRPAFL